MNASRARTRWLAGVVAVGLALTSGCQTWFPEAGLTLPTGDYLRHLPQYFPPSPPFPLSREQADLEAAVNSPNPARPPLPPGVPPGPP